jgi:intergrase/recombinase
MALESPGKTREADAIVERTVRRLYGRRQEDGHFDENAAALVTYLVESGIHDEDELVELARIAHGKRYDPSNGSFL